MYLKGNMFNEITKLVLKHFSKKELMKEDRQHVFFTHSLWIYTSRFAKYEVTEIFPSFNELKKIWCIRNVQDLGHYNNDNDDDNYKIMI